MGFEGVFLLVHQTEEKKIVNKELGYTLVMCRLDYRQGQDKCFLDSQQCVTGLREVL